MAAKKETKKEVATVEEAALPDYLQNYTGPTGAEGIDREDVTVPRIKLAQGTSQEVKDGELNEGDLFLNVTGEVLCAAGDKLRFIPVVQGKEFILWRDRKDGGGIMARAKPVVVAGQRRYAWDKPNCDFEHKVDGKTKVKWTTAQYIDEDGLDQWGSEIPGNDESGIAATAHHNYVVALPDFDYMVVALSLSRSQSKKAKDLNAMLKLGTLPIFARIFTATAIDETNSDGEGYKNYGFKPAGVLQDGAKFEHFKAVNAEYTATGFTVDQSDEDSGEQDGEGDGF